MAATPEAIKQVITALDACNVTDPSERANKLKDEGNKYFKDGVYDSAIEFYTLAINEKPTAILFANRSQCYIKKELFGAALEDAASSIKEDPTYVKAFYRRASAYMALGKFRKALKDYEAVYKAHPKDPDAKRKRDECAKEVKRLAFLEAISQDHTRKPLTEQINIENMEVEDTYDGPRLEGPITIQFMAALIDHFKRQGRLHIRYAFKILLEIYKYFQNQPNMVEIEIEGDNKFTICGDVHGQFYDLVNIFELNGMPSEENPYLFNGDFVDRGSFSVETIFTLFGFKMLLPNHFFLARGNHESDVMNKMYGFEGEVKAKYNSQMCDFFTDIFCYLPLCHLINHQVFVCHGGLFSNDGVTLDDIQKVDRVRQPPDSGIMCDLLWSDPMDSPGRTASKRGVGSMFGPDITQKWCDANDIKYVIRSHEVKPQGYEEQKGGRCYTLFSAPNYCDAVGNLGAFAIITANNIQPTFTTFAAVPHPPVPAMRYANSLFGL